MKRLLSILFLLCLALGSRASFVVSNDDVMTFSASSYDLDLRAEGVTFASYFALRYPGLTNHFRPISRAGEGDQGWYQSEEEKWGLPYWALGTSQVRHFTSPDDNGGYTSNNVIQYRTNIFAAPGLFYNGTATTNEGYSFPMTFFSMGVPPHDSSDGDGGQVDRNYASTNLNGIYGTPIVNLWPELWTNGWNTDAVGSRVLGFSTGSHPYQGGFVAMSLAKLRALGVDTNIATIAFDFSAVSAVTNHCTATGLTKSGASLSGTVRFDCLPMGWVEQPGTVTNQGSMCFQAIPSFANYMTFIIQGTNFDPAAIYSISVNGVLSDTCTGAQLNSGRNWFTNTTGPIWAQRAAVVNAYLDLYGFDHTTLIQTHPAGNGVLGVLDVVGLKSVESQEYDTNGKRGSTYVSAVASSVAQLNAYDAAIYSAAQPVNYTFNISQCIPRLAPFRR